MHPLHRGALDAAHPPQNVFMDRFANEPKVQRVWDIPHATWFTLMGVGGGLFLLARLLGRTHELGTVLGVPLVDLVSFAAIAVGGVILIADLGHPLRAWRAVRNVRTSWISWGAIADFVFLGAGGLLVLADLEFGDSHPFAWLPWDAAADTAAGRVLEVIAMAAAVVVMFYAGAVLAQPRAIPYWHSVAVPIQFLLSSAATSLGVMMLLASVEGATIEDRELLLTAAFLALLLASIAWHLATKRDAPGKRDSLERVVRGRYRLAFLGGVVAFGTVLPLGLALVALAFDGTPRDVAGIAILVLTATGGFGLRLVTLRVGIFPPVRARTPDPRWASPGPVRAPDPA